ncbi:hypothetical protein [Legionella yabuuchiae]|uniref:hypothetical protein n=1 Tax=Legionella yabuuchiae TaxID=376727 RepID=UPI0010553675|nr:hypothetical protein [Legionella yabuuchiae]
MCQLKVNAQWLLIAISVLLIGCTSIGTTILPKNRAGYNDAMILSEEYQLLLNIVRLRFDDRPYFINVDNITSSNNLAFSGELGTSYSAAEKLSASAKQKSSYSDSPTITFTPLQGEKFTREMLTPIDTQVVYTMLEAGFNISKLFRILFYKFGNFNNISSITMPGPPDFQEVMEIVTLLEELQRERAIYFQENLITHVSKNIATAPQKRIKHLETLTEKYYEDRKYEDEKE